MRTRNAPVHRVAARGVAARRVAGSLLVAMCFAAGWTAPAARGQATGATTAPKPAGATTEPKASGAGSEPKPATGRAAVDEAPRPPTAEELAIALADLAQGLKLPTAGERADAVARNAGVADAKVVKALAKFLKDKEQPVRLATLDALGITAHDEALKELHHQLKDARLMADPALAKALLVAIGRHHDAASVKPLGVDAWKEPAAPVAQARLLALGAIRSKAAVAQLMELMNTEPTLPWKDSPYMEDFRLALAELTGIDKGIDKDAWRTWWREAEKTLKVTPEPPKLPAELQSRWTEFWALPAATPAAGVMKGT